MGKYCDSKVLEDNWFLWLLAFAVPDLEKFREAGVLWTKVIGKSTDKEGNVICKNGKTFPDPTYHIRSHCIAFGHPVYFNSYKGKPQSRCKLNIEGEQRLFTIDELREELSLESSSEIHNLNNTFDIPDTIIPSLKKRGFVQEKPEIETWNSMLNDINNMCEGIATRFRPPNSEELSELANEAILQVCQKLKSQRLVYIAGRAPVFNLLTTTIFRVMFSIHNRRSQQKRGMTKLLDDVQAGVLPDHMRSFKVGASLRKYAHNRN
jgi:hypothetical protein